MATPEEMAASMLNNLPEKTGKTLQAWHRILESTGLDKHGALLKHLKQEYGVTHGFANLIVLKYRDTGESDEQSLIDTQYGGAKKDLLPIYQAITSAIAKFGDDVELAPKKAYVSLRRKKQFGLIQPSTKTRVDVGLNLGDTEANQRLEKSASFNAMVSHRVRLSTLADVDDELIGWLKQAYASAG